MRCIYSLLPLALALASCGPRMQITTEAYSGSAAPQPTDVSYVFALGNAKEPTLEQQSQIALAEQELAALGFVTTKDLSRATILVGVDVRIVGQHNELRTFSWPQFGVTGYAGGVTTGNAQTFGNNTTFTATTTLQPTYGVTGYTQHVTSARVSDRVGRVVVLRPNGTDTPPHVFEATVKSSGSCAMLSAVAPPLIHAAFLHFPLGGNGHLVQRIPGGC